ncbi:MAG: PIN domain-containing protein [Gammaproteobacteria bacterium]
MALILFDTNIFIDMLNGVQQATVELSAYDSPAISTITYMELRAGQMLRPHEEPILDAVLNEFDVLPLDPQVTELAIEIRGKSLLNGPKVKLPDAIIAATAAAYNIPIVTRNPRDFAWSGIQVHVPYDYDWQTGQVTNVRPAFSNFKPRPTLTRLR